MYEHPEVLVGVFPYRSAADHDRAEGVVSELTAAGIAADNVQMFVPPLGMPETAGHPEMGIDIAMQALGLDDETARWCQERYRDGHIVVIVHPREFHREAEAIFERHGSRETYRGRPQPVAHPAGTRHDTEPARGSVLRDSETSERHGRGLEPDLTDTDEPLVHDIERGKRDVGW